MKPNLAAIILMLLFFISCSKKDGPSTPVDPCIGLNYTITYSKTESVGGANNGTFTVLGPRGDSLTYKLNSGAYQTSWYFTNLAPGSYVLTIKNLNNCTDTLQFSIANYGPKYALVKQIIIGYCGPCHLNGGISGGANFDTDQNITTMWDRIKIRAVDNLPTQMPELPNSPLTSVDKQKIVDWVNAGHRITD